MVNEVECIFEVYVGEICILVCIFGIFKSDSVGLDLQSCVSHWL